MNDTFRRKAPGIMALFMADLGLTMIDAAAILGNVGHECTGFTKLQEMKPTVPGSRGGFGWPQWTGPRRRAYEAYCARNRLDPHGDVANYRYMLVELRGSEKAAVRALKAAEGLKAKVKAFEMAYERAGAKHYASRNGWAQAAVDAYELAEAAGPVRLPEWADAAAKIDDKAPEVIVDKVVADPGELEKAPAKSKTVWISILTALGAPLAAFGNLDWRVQLAIVAVIVAMAGYAIKRRFDLAAAVKRLRAEVEA
jgi:hypothetical protein